MRHQITDTIYQNNKCTWTLRKPIIIAHQAKSIQTLIAKRSDGILIAKVINTMEVWNPQFEIAR